VLEVAELLVVESVDVVGDVDVPVVDEAVAVVAASV
jgi:hypothetical protein